MAAAFMARPSDCRQVRDIYYVKALEMYGHRDIIGGSNSKVAAIF